jgi:hypothetical protein
MSPSIRRALMMVFVVAALVAATVAPVSAAGQREATKEPVSWWWDDASTTGSSVLVRTDAGLRGVFSTSGLTPGDAVTLWFIIFNHPEACSTSPCSVPADVFNEDAGADFYWGDGGIAGPTGRVSLVGPLAVGQTAYSGKVEIGAGEAVPLSNAHGAEVVLAVHSHGPASTGDELASQLSSFTGGCLVFNGADGFATGPEDLPDAPGECSTLQRALHQ